MCAELRPTYVDDAQRLEAVPLEQYDLVLADPPYSVEDCEHYGTSMVKRNVVMRALHRLPIGAHVVWLDQVLPVFRKDLFAIVGVIGMVEVDEPQIPRRCHLRTERRAESANVMRAERRAIHAGRVL